EPAVAVHAVCERIATEAPGHQYAIAAEFYAFMETRTPHDARRLANVLSHALKRPDLAAEVEALLPQNAHILTHRPETATPSPVRRGKAVVARRGRSVFLRPPGRS